MSESIPINADILKWARTSIGLSIEEVAQKMRRKKEEIKDWELGQSAPTYAQLEKLAYHIYKRPLAVFFFPDVPIEETPKTEFRTLPNTLIEQLPVEMIKLYRKAKIFQFNLEELFENAKPAEVILVDKYRLDEHTNIPLLAEKVRKDLGYSINDQFTWQSLDEAFKKWRKAFESLGVFVFKDAFHNDDFSGFCIYDNKYPIIFINNSMPDSRQIFTLFHELGHLFYHLGGIDFRDNRVLEAIERKYFKFEMGCNKFASEIIVPQKVFDVQNLQVSERQFQLLANKFSVSREVILRKYLDNGLIDNEYYRKMTEKWANQYKNRKKGGHYYYTQIAYLGNTYINLVFGKYYQNKISAENLSSYLNIKETNISTFEHYAFG
ncbi:MAG: hypothetical protein CVT49_06300 [candidate division Zixibacteria bacterium HGW-Zixibacteria-1]|nr:MAG: hypothetical protein CVT49_06300 [candidate division Zixibacteria bacterium HGW-Zixibacteria-1]